MSENYIFHKSELLTFDGTNKTTLNLGVLPKLNALTSDLTVMAWINPTTVSGRRRVVGWRGSNYRGDGGFGGGFGFGVDNDKLLLTSFGVKDYVSKKTLIAGTWTHVAAVFDNSYDVSFYVNGAFIDKVTGGSAGQISNRETYLGSSEGALEFFAGQMRDIRVYNRALSAQDVANLAPKHLAPKHLVLKATDVWLDTGVDVTAGDALIITATGRWKVDRKPQTYEVTADGYGAQFFGTELATANFGSLIGRIGEKGTPFFVGSTFSKRNPSFGRLYLQINDVPNTLHDNAGQISVAITFR